MITVKRYCSTWLGQRRDESVNYDLNKSDVARRIQQAIADGREEFTASDLVRLDAETLPEDKLLSIFSEAEIKEQHARQRQRLADEFRQRGLAIERLAPRVSDTVMLSGKKTRVGDATGDGQDGFESAQGGDEATRAARKS